MQIVEGALFAAGSPLALIAYRQPIARVDWCANGSQNSPACPVAGYSEQDAEFGRDATCPDDSDGHAGFSFTKLVNNGNPLPAGAASWSCVRDNVTGLTWEIKTDDGGLRDKDWTYTWVISEKPYTPGIAELYSALASPRRLTPSVTRRSQGSLSECSRGLLFWKLPGTIRTRRVTAATRVTRMAAAFPLRSQVHHES